MKKNPWNGKTYPRKQESHSLKRSDRVIVSLITLLTLSSALLVSLQRQSPADRAVIDGVAKESHPLVAREPNQVGKSSDAGTKPFSIHQKIDEAPSWAIQYGQEFWHRNRAAAPPPKRQANLPSNISLGDIISRVSHAFRQDGPSDLPQANSSTYVATVDGEGFRLSPKLYAGQREAPGLERDDPARDSASVKIPVFTEDPSTKVRFRTESVRYGSDVLYTSGSEPVPWSVVGNTAQGLLNPQGLIEHYECGDKGVEVSWVLQKRPIGNGPLEIAAQLTGLAYAGQDQAGHHFADSSSNRRVRVGDVEILDAAGSRYEAPLLVENTQLKVQVSAEVLEHATFPIAIDPVIGPEFGMTFFMASHAQYEPAVASNGTDYCVVWSDLRNGTEDLFMTMVRNDGSVIYPAGVVVIADPLPSVDPLTAEIASNGTDFLVAWLDGRNPPMNGIDIYGARIKGDGSLPDGTGFPISTAVDNQYRPRLAGNANGYFVVWQDDRSNGSGHGDIFGARVTSAGTVLDPDGISISESILYASLLPQVASDGANYLVTYVRDVQDGFTPVDVVASRVSSSGILLDPSGVLIQGDASMPSIAYASTAGKYLISYVKQNPATFVNEVRGKQVTTTGGVSAGSEITINSAHNARAGFPAEVASNGTNYLVVWTADPGVDVFGARVRASDGAVLDPAGFSLNALADEQIEVAVASNGADYLAVWLDGSSAENGAEQNDIFGSRVRDLDGRALDYIPISTVGTIFVTQKSKSPAVGSDGSNFLIVWSDDRNSASSAFDIYGTRVSPSSLVLDPGGIAISTAAGDQLAPDVTWNGVNYLVAWTDNRNGSSSDIYGARVSASGILQDSSGIAISMASGNQVDVRLTSNGSDYFVVWEDYRNSQTIPDVFGARVTSSGIVSDSSGIAISTRSSYERNPDTAYNGTDYVVVWEDNRNPPTGDLQLFGTRISTTGVVLDANGFPIATGVGSQRMPAIARASSGSDCLVVFSVGRNIFGTRVASNGSVIDTPGFVINSNSADKLYLAVGALSDGYLVVWYNNFDQGGNFGDVYGARVTTAATVLDPTGSELKITDWPINQIPNPNSVAANATTYLVAYWDSNIGKTFANFVSP